MAPNESAEQRQQRLEHTFQQDGSVVAKRAHVNECVGLLAEHQPSGDGSGRKKRVYYVEGTPWEMGRLVGQLAEPMIAEVTKRLPKGVLWHFVDGAVDTRTIEEYLARADLLNLKLKDIAKWGPRLLHHFVLKYTQSRASDMQTAADHGGIPGELAEEMEGIVAGCEAACGSNPTEVTLDKLWLLNAGVDCFVTAVYRWDKVPGLVPRLLLWLLKRNLRIPLMCNAFALFGDATENGHFFFGRDFMFPNGGVFQDAACLIIYNPTPGNGAIPFVAQTAPGLVGSMVAMNKHGVAAGVHMVPAANCNPRHPGLNSLNLVRYSVERSPTAQDVVRCMVDARRGASWAYVVGYAGDGANPPEACVVEAGKAGSEEEIDCRGYPPDWVLRLLPQDDAQHPAFQNGLMVRPHDFDYPSAYLCDVNPGLWEEKLGRDPYPEAFTERGYIGECPESYYFPPQRETRDDVLVAANAFLIPRMRLCSMYKSTNLVVASRCRDLQWRYDRLNQLILDTLEQEGKIGYDRARALIDFLSPLGPYNPDYYATAAPRDKDTGDPAIEGSVSLCDLTDRTIESHFGYYPDDWVKIDLTHYV